MNEDNNYETYFIENDFLSLSLPLCHLGYRAVERGIFYLVNGLVVGGDKLDYSNDTTSPAASLIETKLLLNSVISDSARGVRFMTLDIKDFFLQTTMKECKYMKIHEKYFS